MKNKVYEIITNKIIERLENGVIPWRKPWVNGISRNWVTQKPYRGINTFLLNGGEYATKKQILEANGWIKKEEFKNYHIVVYWLWKEIKNEETDEVEKRYAKPFYYKVWEISSQVEGLAPKQQTKTFDHDPIVEAEKIKDNYINAPDYSFMSGAAWYKPFQDLINVPPMKDFENIHEYYSTLFHEMIHSTGHESRLNREGIASLNGFGTERYSKEELIAELGASMLCGIAGIDNETVDNSASYIQSWLSKLKNDKKLIIHASQKAQKAADYIIGENFSE